MRGEDIDHTWSHRLPGVQLWVGTIGNLFSLPGMALARQTTRRFRFDVNSSGLLHSMVLHGHCRLCNGDNQCTG